MMENLCFFRATLCRQDRRANRSPVRSPSGPGLSLALNATRGQFSGHAPGDGSKSHSRLTIAFTCIFGKGAPGEIGDADAPPHHGIGTGFAARRHEPALPDRPVSSRRRRERRVQRPLFRRAAQVVPAHLGADRKTPGIAVRRGFFARATSQRKRPRHSRHRWSGMRS